MFRRKEYQKSSSFFPLVIFRFFLTIVIFAVFLIGLYQAFYYFSGVDPIKTKPEKLLVAALTSEKSAQLIKNLLGVDISDKLSKVSEVLPGQTEQPTEESQPAKSGEVILKFALVTDSHTDNTNLKEALVKAKEKGAKFVIGLGDYTKVGDLESLKKVQQIFQASHLPYYLTAGDHDLWAARNDNLKADAYFSKIFGSPYQSFADSSIRFIIVFNSDNYLGIDPLQQHWLEEELTRVDVSETKLIFVFLHEPLYHPSSDHVMGKGDSEQQEYDNPKIKQQANQLISLFHEKNVAEVFAGDTHFFGEYQEPETGLKMTAVGALASDPNTQKPRFAIIDVFSDGSYNVEDLEI